ncbi:MAG: hypothetical protein ABI779_12700 [Acidobacteriota bacterium]
MSLRQWAVIVALAPAAWLGGCAPEQRAPAPAPSNLVGENARLQRELDESKHKLELQGRYTADATQTLNELQDHLANIATLEGQVRGGEEGQELTASRREKMLGAVQQMQDEVALQEKLIAGFREREPQYTEKVAELGAAITRFEGMIATKNEEIARLRHDLESVVVENEALREDQRVQQEEMAGKQEVIEQQQQEVQSLRDEMRAAGYIIAPMRTLLDQGLIVQRRLLLRKVWKLAPTFDPARLERIDTADVRQLNIAAPPNRIEVITPHPPGSYSVTAASPNRSVFTINDPDRFWTTRYLVIGIR